MIRDLEGEGFSAAAMNYVYSRLANAYIETWGLRYERIKDVQGVYTGALDEFNERVARPYEALKLDENGTVWTCLDPPHQELTDEQVDALMITDGHGQTWMKCYEGDCALVVVGPGKVFCDHCEARIDSDFQQGET